MLGSSETIGRFADLFRLIDKKQKIYLKKTAPSDLHFEFVTGGKMQRGGVIVPPMRGSFVGETLDMHREVDRLLLKKFAPPGVVVNEEFEILQFRGHTGEYLEPAPGEASLQLLKMARESLQPVLRGLLNKALKSNVSVRHEGVKLYTDNGKKVTVEVDPIRGQPGSGHFFLVTFQATAQVVEKTDTIVDTTNLPEQTAPGDTVELQRLREELTASKEYLHSIIE